MYHCKKTSRINKRISHLYQYFFCINIYIIESMNTNEMKGGGSMSEVPR